MIKVYGAEKAVVLADNLSMDRLLRRWASEAAEHVAAEVDRMVMTNMVTEADGDTLNISENDEDWQPADDAPVLPPTRALLWGALGDGECGEEAGEPVCSDESEWDGVVPEPFLSDDPDTVFTVLQHYYDLLDAINHPSNKTGSTKIMLQCDDCKHGPCDVTAGVDETHNCHAGKNNREDGLYVGKFR